MELIRRAVERARTGTVESVRQDPRAPQERVPQEVPRQQVRAPRVDAVGQAHVPIREFTLNSATLEAHRIVAHDVANPLRKAFDILRTQVLQAMDEKDFHIIAVTSPSPGCGKTVTAINLALSIARQPQRSVLLMDMDLQRPKIAEYLGLSCEKGLLGVLGGALELPAATVRARIGSLQLSAVLAERGTQDSSEWMTSQAMASLLQDIRRTCRSQVVIIDLPPMLTSDDVMAVLPLIDCVLFVTAVGVSTSAEIEDCYRHLKSTEVVRIVLNKAPQASASYAGGSY